MPCSAYQIWHNNLAKECHHVWRVAFLKVVFLLMIRSVILWMGLPGPNLSCGERANRKDVKTLGTWLWKPRLLGTGRAVMEGNYLVYKEWFLGGHLSEPMKWSKAARGPQPSPSLLLMSSRLCKRSVSTSSASIHSSTCCSLVSANTHTQTHIHTDTHLLLKSLCSLKVTNNFFVIKFSGHISILPPCHVDSLQSLTHCWTSPPENSLLLALQTHTPPAFLWPLFSNRFLCIFCLDSSFKC